MPLSNAHTRFRLKTAVSFAVCAALAGTGAFASAVPASATDSPRLTLSVTMPPGSPETFTAGTQITYIYHATNATGVAITVPEDAVLRATEQFYQYPPPPTEVSGDCFKTAFSDYGEYGMFSDYDFDLPTSIPPGWSTTCTLERVATADDVAASGLWTFLAYIPSPESSAWSYSWWNTYAAEGYSDTPTITGAAQVGSTLQLDPWWFVPFGAPRTFQWLRDGANIPGATSTSYTLAPEDTGSRISVRVASPSAGVAFSSDPTEPVTPAAVTIHPIPTITGTPRVGATLTAQTGTWSPAADLTYQWYRNSTAIEGANRPTYTLVAADLGSVITVAVTGSRPGHPSVTKESEATSKVTEGTLVTEVPRVSGTTKVGKKLTAKPGEWTPGTKLTYQWYRGGRAVKGATASTYTLKAADRGKKIKVTVTGSLSGYLTVARGSKATAKVAKGTLKTKKPKISGTKKVGKKLTAKPGKWTPGTKLTYQWYRGSRAIKGATASTYKLKAKDRGKKIKVRVTGKKTGYASTSRTSNATRSVR